MKIVKMKLGFWTLPEYRNCKTANSTGWEIYWLKWKLTNIKIIQIKKSKSVFDL